MRTIAGARRSLDKLSEVILTISMFLSVLENGEKVVIGGITSGVLLTALTGPIGPAVYVGLLYSGSILKTICGSMSRIK